MNNKQFIQELAQRTGYTQDDVQKMVFTLTEMQNFGTFEVKKRLERVMTNPSTGQRMLVPPKLVLNFKPVASIKEKLKKGEENG